MSTFTPVAKPTKSVVSKLIRALVEPTAARDCAPAKRPTTITSAALYKSCRMLLKAKGKEKRMRLERMLPLVISNARLPRHAITLSPLSFFSLLYQPLSMETTGFMRKFVVFVSKEIVSLSFFCIRMYIGAYLLPWTGI